MKNFFKEKSLRSQNRQASSDRVIKKSFFREICITIAPSK